VIFGLNTLSVRVLDDADKAILALFRSYAEVGRYTVAFRVASYVLFPARAVLGRFMPAIFKAGTDDAQELPRIARAARRQLFGAVLLSGPVLAVAALCLPLVLGSRYSAAVPMAIVMIPLLGIRGVHWIYGDILVALGRVRTRLAAQFMALVVPLACYFGLSPLLGAWGAVIATGIGEAVTILWMRRFAASALGERIGHPVAVAGEPAIDRV